MLPIKITGRVIGLFCLSQNHEYNWKPEIYKLSKTITDIIANYWERCYQFQAYLEAEKQRIEAVRSNEKILRLASVGTLAAGIAHEINQPLNALKLRIDTMLYWGEHKQDELKDNLMPHLYFISEQASRINDIIKQMMNLSMQGKNIKPLPVNTNEMIQLSLSLVRKQITTHNIKIKLNLNESLPPVFGNIAQMQHLILNLVTNAIHSLHTSSRKNKIITISTRESNNKCIIEVSDNGPGIPEKYVDHLFDPFFTTKIEPEGMGLGLAIVQNIIAGLNGTITVTNKEKGGACFVIALPFHQKIKLGEK